MWLGLALDVVAIDDFFGRLRRPMWELPPPALLSTKSPNFQEYPVLLSPAPKQTELPLKDA